MKARIQALGLTKIKTNMNEQQIIQVIEKWMAGRKQQLIKPIDQTSIELLHEFFPYFYFNTTGGKLNKILIGRATLTAGTVTVSTTFASSNCEFLLTHRVAGGTLGTLSVGTITAGDSFVINSSSNTDTSEVTWMLIKP
jgi:hypothetical protein